MNWIDITVTVCLVRVERMIFGLYRTGHQAGVGIEIRARANVA